MSRSLSYTFPAARDDDVSLLQDCLAGVALELNGNLSNSINSEVSFLEHGYSRSISISSLNDLSLATFTITGTQNGVLLTEEVVGPNAGIVLSDEIFDVILSITVDINILGVEIGSGSDGFFPIINVLPEKDFYRWSLVIQAGVAGLAIPTSMDAIVKNIINNGSKYLDNTSSFIELKAQSIENIYYHSDDNNLYRSILIAIEGDETTLARAMTLDFIQI